MRAILPVSRERFGDLHHHGLSSAFPVLRQPCSESFRKAFRREPKAGFDLPIGDGEGVVKIHGIGEVAHAELVQPLERAGLRFALNHHMHIEFLRVHAFGTATGSGQGDLEEPDSFALCWIHDQSLCLPFVLAEIGLGPTSVGDQCRHVVFVFVSGVFRVREKAYRPRLSPAWPALFQRCLQREQHFSRLGDCIDLVDADNNKDSFVPIIDSNNFSRIVALTTFLRRGLRNNPG